MSIHMRALLPATYSWLEELCNEREWVPIFAYMEPELVAWLAVCLEFVDDEGDAFPHGKWATIQRLQDMVREEAKREATSPDRGSSSAVQEPSRTATGDATE